MQIFPFVVVAWILAVGLYGLVTSRHLVHLIICLIVVQSSTYVLLLGVGYKTGAVAPYFFDIPRHTAAVELNWKVYVIGGKTVHVVRANTATDANNYIQVFAPPPNSAQSFDQ